MEDDELVSRLERVKRPDSGSAAQQRQLRLVLVSARRSSWVGLVLILCPCLFILGVLLKYGLRVEIPLFSALEEKMAAIDRSPYRFLSIFLLAGCPLAALALNLLAITHVQIDRLRRELQVTVKLKIINLVISAICLFILGMIFAHVVAENVRVSPH
jgi:hypothetical protein